MSPNAANVDAFIRMVMDYRKRRSWTQERLGLESGLSHSLISRIESGQRPPTREAIGKLADGLGLSDEQGDLLLLLAGFAPRDTANILTLRGEHEVAELCRLLADPGVSRPTKERVRTMIAGLAGLAGTVPVSVLREEAR